jgi:hypothetical protein
VIRVFLKSEAFIGALRKAGASVDIHSTRRPRERAYLMNTGWRIAKHLGQGDRHDDQLERLAERRQCEAQNRDDREGTAHR